MQSPSPQAGGQASQSGSQEKQSSPWSASHEPLPQLSQASQSAGQLAQSSASSGSHRSLPQLSHAPQSAGHEAHDSPCATSQLLLPHSAQSVQGMHRPSLHTRPDLHTCPSTQGQPCAPGLQLPPPLASGIESIPSSLVIVSGPVVTGMNAGGVSSKRSTQAAAETANASTARERSKDRGEGSMEVGRGPSRV